MLVQYVIVFVSFFQSNDYIDIKIRICEEFLHFANKWESRRRFLLKLEEDTVESSFVGDQCLWLLNLHPHEHMHNRLFNAYENYPDYTTSENVGYPWTSAPTNKNDSKVYLFCSSPHSLVLISREGSRNTF